MTASALRALTLASGLLLLAGEASASAITSVGYLPASNGNGSLISSSIVYPGGSAIGQSTGTVNLSLNATAKNTVASFAPLSGARTMDLNFNMVDTSTFPSAPGDGITSRVYDFFVTITNAIGTGSPTQPPAIGDDIQNVEFIIESVGGLVPTFSTPSSDAGPLVYTNSGRSVLRFGGLNGGGPAIAYGGSRTFQFQITAPAMSNSWNLRIAANPEPATIILALMAISGFGFYLHRQRRAQLNLAAAANTAA